MRLLLDTHLLIWAADGDGRLTPKARELIASASQVYFSAATIWEVAIKTALGKLHQDPVQMNAMVRAAGYVELPISAAHAAEVARLPRHHGDPFDRLLIVQAASEGLTLLTVDRALAAYGQHVLVV